MRIFITGICGFVGSRLAMGLGDRLPGVQISGIDNMSRPGSQTNVEGLRLRGVSLVHGDIRSTSDLESVVDIDWIIDAAALTNVAAGLDGKVSSRQLVGHNLLGTINLLELAKSRSAGLMLLSTSRVYSVRGLSQLPVQALGDRFELDPRMALPPGCSNEGIAESFSTAAPISLYGSTKLASEIMAQEYGQAFGFPVLINRCGVMAGGGQFGTAEQGIFSYWVRAYANKRPLRYIGFDGFGRQVRDALHPDDLVDLVVKQLQSNVRLGLWNVGGGREATMSLHELSNWCADRFGPHGVQADLSPRPFDAPWIVMDSRICRQEFGWSPQRSVQSILEEIAEHHRRHPDWLEVSA